MSQHTNLPFGAGIPATPAVLWVGLRIDTGVAATRVGAACLLTGWTTQGRGVRASEDTLSIKAEGATCAGLIAGPAMTTVRLGIQAGVVATGSGATCLSAVESTFWG